MKTPKAIPTVYKGVQFRSRLESQCAVLFDKLGWEWKYEPFSLMLPSGIAYIPDFWLPEHGILVEPRGYKNDRSQRQIVGFVDMVAAHPQGASLDECFYSMPNGDSLSAFLVIGPSTVKLHEFSPHMQPAAIVVKCDCHKWRPLLHYNLCQECGLYPPVSVAMAIGYSAGKILLNGVDMSEVDI